MKGMNAVMGWLLMLAVLAVPSFLFHNWWEKNKAPAAGDAAPAAVSQEAFPAAEGQPQDRPSAVPSAQAAVPAAQPQTSTQPARGGDAVMKPAAAPLRSDEPVMRAAPAQEPQPAASTQAASTQAARGGYNPRSLRNPMLSVEEFRRIKAEQEERAAEERAARMGTYKKPKDPGFETKIRLQGIVGNAAIINNDMYYVGQSVYGGKILKIGADYVVVEYRGKKIVKKLQ